jgi:glutamate-ammonia-ligase adenylyltransferase
MRDKMRGHLLPRRAENAGKFHLKQGSGGIVDIEFMVQFAVLAWAHHMPDLTIWTDNIRILETLSRQGLFSKEDSRTLVEAYISYRTAAHQLALQQQSDVVDADRFRAERAAVITRWKDLLEGGKR